MAVSGKGPCLSQFRIDQKNPLFLKSRGDFALLSVLCCFMCHIRRLLEDSLADEWHYPAVKAVFASVVAREQDDESKEDVSWVM